MKIDIAASRRMRLLLMLLLVSALAFVLNLEQRRQDAQAPAKRVIKVPKPKIEVAKPKYPIQLIKAFPFSDQNELNEWEEKVFKGRVLYEIQKNAILSYVNAKSEAAASALYYKVKLDPDNEPIMSWKWRVDKFPDKTMPENLESQEEHDFAARVYVIFPTVFILNSKVLEYIWAKDLPVGSSGTSPYSKNIRLLVLESGPAGSDEWRFEERDILADYTKAFGRPPERDIGAIAFMTNTEHTGTSADADYDDIKVGYKDKSTTKGGI